MQFVVVKDVGCGGDWDGALIIGMVGWGWCGGGGVCGDGRGVGVASSPGPLTFTLKLEGLVRDGM